MKRSNGVVELAPGALLDGVIPEHSPTVLPAQPISNEPPTAKRGRRKKSDPGTGEAPAIDQGAIDDLSSASKRTLFGADLAVLSKAESVELRPGLVDGVVETCQKLDSFINLTNRAGRRPEIWSTVSRRDAEVLADAILILGVKNPVVGFAVRGMVKTWKLYRAGLIAGPRFVESIIFYAANGGPSLWPLMQMMQGQANSYGQEIVNQTRMADSL